MMEMQVLTSRCVLELVCAAEKVRIHDGMVVELFLRDGFRVTLTSDEESAPNGRDVCRDWRHRVKLLLSAQTY